MIFFMLACGCTMESTVNLVFHVSYVLSFLKHIYLENKLLSKTGWKVTGQTVSPSHSNRSFCQFSQVATGRGFLVCARGVVVQMHEPLFSQQTSDFCKFDLNLKIKLEVDTWF